MRDFLCRRTTRGELSTPGRRRRSGLFALLGVMMLVLLVPAAALSGGGDQAAPGQTKAAGEPAAPAPAKAAAADAAKPQAARPAHPATPATPASPPQAAKPAHPAGPAHPAKPATPARPARPAHPAKAAAAGKSAAAQHHVIICHRTGSATNPYVVINVSIRAWQHGHQTHPALDGRSDILLKDPAQPGEKLPVSRCTSGAPAGSPSSPTAGSPSGSAPGSTPAAVNNAASAPVGTLVVDATTPGAMTPAATATVHQPLAIVVHTVPDARVTVAGAGVLGATKTRSNKRGVATLKVVPTRQGLLTVKVGSRPVERVGVLGVQTSGSSLTG